MKKEILRYVLAIILTIAIIIYVVVNVLSSTILNKKFVLDKLDETSYYLKVYSITKSNFENYIQQSGFDETVLDGVISEEMIKRDTGKMLTNIYNNITEEVTTDEIKAKLYENIKKQTKDMTLTSAQQIAIDSFVSQLCFEYFLSISHYTHEKEIYSNYVQINSIVEMAYKVDVVIIGIVALLLILLSKHRIYKFFVFIGISLLSSGLFLTIANIYINSKVNIQAITIVNESLSFALREILEAIQNIVQTNATYLMIASPFLIIIPSLIHYKRKYQSDN